jgi:hypothetical protein
MKQNGYSHMREVYFALCKSVNTPVSLGAWLRFENGEHLDLAKLEVRADNYLDANAFRKDYLVVSFLSKWKGLETGLDLEAEALQKFATSETLCKQTNRDLRKWRKESFDALLGGVLFSAKRKIARLLGPFSLFCVDEGFGWGPGATADISRRQAFLDTKISKLPISCTKRASGIFLSIVSTDLHWSARILEVTVDQIAGPFSFLPSVLSLVETCSIDTVAKNAKTHRVIAKEPTANGFLQKGVGKYMRQRLKRAGIDLDDQGPNQEGAQSAYTDRRATLDLKAASDSLAVELVYELLPFDWADFLDQIRSREALLKDGSRIKLEKFSSMGNGFTFELESLIFWAICSSINDAYNSNEKVLVYGDDLIVSQEIADDVIRILGLVGFQTNKDKSFVSGQFFESCGRHFFGGIDVTPIYQKEVFYNDVETIRCGNRLLRLAGKWGANGRACPFLIAPWKAAWRLAGPTRVFQLPYGVQGDDGWILPAEYFSPVGQDINLGLHCRVVPLPTRRLPACDRSLLAWTLRRGVVTDSPFNGEVSVPVEQVPEILYGKPHRRWVMPSGEFDLAV